ncbi:MAG: ClpX C4-type zinc finger protein [Myxococcales bacterium]|nr:ClpX C4-type zinc finger protein [Myxococcales bacterium]
MSWLKRVLGRGRPTDPAEPDVSCSFCGRHRREVRKLVSGPGVYVCDGCVLLCDQILDDEAHKDGEASYYAGALLSAVAQLGAHAPYARARPALRAVIELGRRHRLVLREVMGSAVHLDDLDTAVAALRAIPAADRTPIDTIDLGGLLADLEHHDEAVTALATVEPGAVDGIGAVLHTLHDVQARLERGGLDASAIATLRGRVTELEGATATLPAGASADAVRARRLGVMTVAALAARSLDAAEHSARAYLAACPDCALAHHYLARVLTARGDVGGARAARAAGLEFAHPEGPYAARLSSTTAESSPFR